MDAPKQYICSEIFLQEVENVTCKRLDGSITLEELREILENMPSLCAFVNDYDDHDVSGLIEDD